MATTSTSLVSGCLDTAELDDSDSGGTDSRGYERWMQPDHGRIDFEYVGWDSVRPLGDVTAGFRNAMIGGTVDRDLAREAFDFVPKRPIRTLQMLPHGVGVGLFGTGLEGIAYTADGANEGTVEFGDDFGDVEVEIRSFESTVDELLRVDDAMILTGEFDVAEVGERITDDPTDTSDAKIEYERTDEIGDYECYKVVDSSYPLASSQELLAVSEEAIIGSQFIDADSWDEVRESVGEVAESDGTAIDEKLEFLLETARHGDVVVGSYDHAKSAEFRNGEDWMEETNSIVISLESTDSTVTNGAFAATFDDLDDETEATLKSDLDTPDGDVDIDIDDERATASVVWDEPVLE
ncbi:hypothetical protein AB7C87_04535 [Natrarchaeobius sp. A-rgal3]|uniref:hypothetical protein n=1 Tax=Natrarchaeobius versutus TaxID=1679078 RepID=UPI00350EBE90